MVVKGMSYPYRIVDIFSGGVIGIGRHMEGWLGILRGELVSLFGGAHCSIDDSTSGKK